jgi:crossover junction endodeoxyribonuclease RuvC
MAQRERIILGIDPGLAHTGWGIVRQHGSKLSCLAYGCIVTTPDQPLEQRLRKIYEQMSAVVGKYHPSVAGIETVWFGNNVTSAFATGQARGAALVACAQADVKVSEFAPSKIKGSVVGTGSADKEQVQYMVKQILQLDRIPSPDHSADALAAAIAYTTHDYPALQER